MARPIKQGIDYFPLDCFLDDKFKLIEAEFGLKGFAVIVKLFQKIYGERGYYCEWTKEVALLFGCANGLGDTAVSEIVSAAITRGIFNKDLFNKYSILTSEGIQKRYMEAVSRRNQILIDNRYLLITAPKNWVIVYNNSKNVYNNSKNVDNNPQSKEKKSKVNKSILKESIKENACKQASHPQKHKYGEYKNVLLTDDEYRKLTEEYSDISERIERLSEYIASKGVSYKSHYATIRAWARKDNKTSINKNKDPFMEGLQRIYEEAVANGE